PVNSLDAEPMVIFASPVPPQKICRIPPCPACAPPPQPVSAAVLVAAGPVGCTALLAVGAGDVEAVGLLAVLLFEHATKTTADRLMTSMEMATRMNPTPLRLYVS